MVIMSPPVYVLTVIALNAKLIGSVPIIPGEDKHTNNTPWYKVPNSDTVYDPGISEGALKSDDLTQVVGSSASVATYIPFSSSAVCCQRRIRSPSKRV